MMKTLHAYIKNMVDSSSTWKGMDYLIFVAGTDKEKRFWEHQFSRFRFKNVRWIVVSEGFEIGAGNGLGTLAAFVLASKLVYERWGESLESALVRGCSVAMYHTAGKGMRLYPLPLADQGFKSAVRLPSLCSLVEGSPYCETLLEAVVRQTQIFSSFRKGRLSVFWGDQVFVPSNPLFIPNTHIEILSQLRPLPRVEDWSSGQWNQYGVIGKGKDGLYRQFEKLTHARFGSLMSHELGYFNQGFAKSLGCFSLSHAFLHALIEEFQEEIEAKVAKYDADPHFWMPLTLPQDVYLSIMQDRHESKLISQKHYTRMNCFKEKWGKKNHSIALLGIADLGAHSLFWDFGQASMLYSNVMQLVQTNEEAQLFKLFLGLNDMTQNLQVNPLLDVDSCSCVHNSILEKGKIRRSVVVSARCPEITLEDSVVLESAAPQIEGTCVFVYKAFDDVSMILPKGSMRADMQLESGKSIAFCDQIHNSPKEVWNKILPLNRTSYAEAFRLVAQGQ